MGREEETQKRETRERIRRAAIARGSNAAKACFSQKASQLWYCTWCFFQYSHALLFRLHGASTTYRFARAKAQTKTSEGFRMVKDDDIFISSQRLVDDGVISRGAQNA